VLGTMYVLEGSRLGAKALLRQVSQSRHPEAHEASAFLSPFLRARAQNIQERMMETAASHAHSRSAIFDFIADYRKMIGSDGLAVWSDEKLTLSGETPTEDEVMDLIGFINRTTPGRICASAEIAKIYASGTSFRDRAAGFLAIPISRRRATA
jgi:light-regulated signal transduction histidine kinase (bacteriophytochrome)